MKQDLRRVYQMKVSLNRAKPPIWRRLLVSSETDLATLHGIIQIAMGWTDSHLHQFTVKGKRYGCPDPEWDDGLVSERGIQIGTLLRKAKQSMLYEYDFGDGWEHTITLEKVLSTKDEASPSCVGGRRGCPPEDVGGVYGYMHFLEVYQDTSHPEHAETVEWAGEYFEPERFDIAEVNRALASGHK